MSIRTSAGSAFRLVPIHAVGQDTPLGICVVARKAPDAHEGYPLLLRSTADAMVYLGCICDAAETIREWIEIWVQSLEGLETSFSSTQEPFSKERWNQRWQE